MIKQWLTPRTCLSSPLPLWLPFWVHYQSNNWPFPAGIDMTRLALSSYDIWGDILATNRTAIDHA